VTPCVCVPLRATLCCRYLHFACVPPAHHPLTCPSSGRVTCPSSCACLTCEQKITAYQQDPAWISWLALVEVETFALRDGFLPSDLLKLDDQQKTHLELFQAVPEYKDAEKPKHWLRANYPIDIWNTGPLIRTWCMTFEAMLQTLKDIAANSNYRNVCKRMATIYALRIGLLLKGEKLTHWNATQLTFQGSPIVVQGGQVEQQVELKHFETLAVGQATEVVEIQTVTSVDYPGACFNVCGWVMAGFNAEPAREELIYICGILERRDVNGSSRVLMQTCHFSFQQLCVRQTANRLCVPLLNFQSIMEQAGEVAASLPPHLAMQLADFNPPGCTGVNGQWPFAVTDFMEMMDTASYFRPIHLSGSKPSWESSGRASAAADDEDLIFIFR